MKEIKRICIFANDTIRHHKIKKELEEKLLKEGFKITSEDYDLAISVGGDGSFLRMVKNTGFNIDTYYIGINAGTLGFAQEVKLEHIDEFIKKLKNKSYDVREIGFEIVEVFHNGTKDLFHALNETTIRDNELNTTKLDIKIDGHHLETFVGDGILISTSFGSTAYNLSFGGSIIHNELNVLEMTPIAPLSNVAYRCLNNSIIIPQNKTIEIIPKENKSNLIVSVDGMNRFYENVEKIIIHVDDKRIKCLSEKDYDFIDKINEKFLD